MANRNHTSYCNYRHGPWLEHGPWALSYVYFNFNSPLKGIDSVFTINVRNPEICLTLLRLFYFNIVSTLTYFFKQTSIWTFSYIMTRIHFSLHVGNPP